MNPTLHVLRWARRRRIARTRVAAVAVRPAPPETDPADETRVERWPTGHVVLVGCAIGVICAIAEAGVRGCLP